MIEKPKCKGNARFILRGNAATISVVGAMVLLSSSHIGNNNVIRSNNQHIVQNIEPIRLDLNSDSLKKLSDTTAFLQQETTHMFMVENGNRSSMCIYAFNIEDVAKI